MSLSPLTVATLTGVLLPVLVGLVTRVTAPARVKVIANIVLSGAAALVLNAVNEQGYAVLSEDMVAVFVQQTVIAVAAYLGVYKPLGAPQRLLPEHGLR